MYRLSKKFRFEAAHRLAKGYVGKCAHVHGHSWNGEICVAVEGLNELGMGVDFSDIKIVTKKIEEVFDHKLILCVDDADLIAFCKDHEWNVVELEENPTSEVIAHWIWEFADSFFKAEFQDVKVEKVILEETCTSRCEYVGG